MNSLAERLLEALKVSPYWTNNTRISGNTIQGLICPLCGDKTAWAYSEPMAINCNKLGRCQGRTKTLELFPEVRRNIERDFPPKKTEPHRPARKYLLLRGIPDTILEGLDYRYLKNVRNTGSGAVLFPVGRDEKGKEILNGRLFSPPDGEGKTHNTGNSSGRFWSHPNFPLDPARKVWITEGTLDALSLLVFGKQALAVLSAGQDPKKIDLKEFKHLVLAFDNDEAGRKAVKRWKVIYPEAEVALPNPGMDWNDILQSGPLDQAKKKFDDDQARYRHNGKLALAENAHEYAETWNEFEGRPPSLFHFNGST